NEIKKLPADHYLTCTARSLEVREYWDVPLPPAGEEDGLNDEALRAQLRDAVRIQLRSDVPIGAFLSGGVDSTTVVATMTEQPGPELMTCSVGFPQDGYSELAHSHTVAASVGSQQRSRLLGPASPPLVP